MKASELIEGKRYGTNSKDLGIYEGVFKTESYFEDIGEVRGVSLHQFRSSTGWSWLFDREVDGSVVAIA